MLMISEKSSKNSLYNRCNTCNFNFHRVAYHVLQLVLIFFWLNSSISITETPTNMKICMYIYRFYSLNVNNVLIFSLTLLLLVLLIHYNIIEL